MSLDNFSECHVCKERAALFLWIHIFGSLDHAAGQEVKSAMPGLGVLMPGPGVLKICACFNCLIVRPCLDGDYTKEELDGMAKRQKEQAKQGELAAKLSAFLGKGQNPEGAPPA